MSESRNGNYYGSESHSNYSSSDTKYNKDPKDTHDTIDDLINKFREGKINSVEFAISIEKAKRDDR